MREDVICAGFGGQGIMLLGKFIAYGAMNKGLHVTWMPSYGAEVRGGTAHSMVIVSDKRIASPILDLCDTAIIMNKPSLGKFLSRIKPGGMLILNTSIAASKISRKDIKVIKVPMTAIAHKLGNVRVANMAALGAYMKRKKLFSRDIVKEGLKIAFPGKKNLVNLNIEALDEGLSVE